MAPKIFYSFLIGISFLLAVLLWVVDIVLEIPVYSEMSYAAIFFLFLFNVFVFQKAKHYSENSDDKRYLGLIFANFLVKIVLVVGIPIVYVLLKKPQESWFIVPYIVIYIIFTIFETWYLNKGAIMRR